MPAPSRRRPRSSFPCRPPCSRGRARRVGPRSRPYGTVVGVDDGGAGAARTDRPGRELDDAVEGCAAAHQRLLADLASLEDAEVGRPSLLPGWTIGHVLTHLARNADSQRHVLEAAVRGEPAERYPGGPQQRTGDIEAGAGRPAAALVEDVRRTIWQLEGAWPAVPAEGWELVGTSLGRPEPVA